MTSNSSTDCIGASKAGLHEQLPTLAATLAVVAALWLASSQGYYALVGRLGLENGYDDAPLVFTAYYATWTAIALLWFRNALAARLAPGMVMADVRAMLPLLVLFALFTALVLPGLPPVSAWLAPPNPPEFMFASGWYYLPKSADILFQQVLVASLIRTAASLRLGLKSIAIGLAVTFGGFHLLLALDGFSPFYVARFTLAATLFGFVAPWLYLRTANGFRWAYSLHWSFYALDATITRLVLAAPPPLF